MPHPIVIIDGNDDILQSWQAFLVDEGYTTILFHSAHVALDYLRDQPSSIVIFDHVWPYEQENTILTALTSTPPIGHQHVYILMSTRITLPLDVGDILQRLHIPVIVKPFDLAVVSEIIIQAEERLQTLSSNR